MDGQDIRVLMIKQGPVYPQLLGTDVTELKGEDGFPNPFDHYYDLNLEINFTGKMLLGRDFIREYYIHMGHQQAWSYETVYEFEFTDGKLINIIDLSKCVAELRKDINNNPTFFEDLRSNIPWFVHNSFATDYENKAWWIKKYEDLKAYLWQ